LYLIGLPLVLLTRLHSELKTAMATKGVSSFAGRTLTVTVVFAERDRVWQTELSVQEGADIGSVLKQSGFAQACPDYPIDTPAVGIFGRRCNLSETVSQGDRIEIYRPLKFDPMESRRRRAAHRKAAQHNKKE